METSFVMFLCCAAVAVARLWKQGTLTMVPAVVTAGVPAFAAILFVLIVVAVPSLGGGGKLKFPVNLTFPLVYSGLVLMTAGFLLRIGSSLSAPDDRIAPAELWQQPVPVITALIAQAVVLSAFIAAGRGSTSEDGSASQTSETPPPPQAST